MRGLRGGGTGGGGGGGGVGVDEARELLPPPPPPRKSSVSSRKRSERSDVLRCFSGPEVDDGEEEDVDAEAAAAGDDLRPKPRR